MTASLQSLYLKAQLAGGSTVMEVYFEMAIRGVANANWVKASSGIAEGVYVSRLMLYKDGPKQRNAKCHNIDHMNLFRWFDGQPSRFANGLFIEQRKLIIAMSLLRAFRDWLYGMAKPRIIASILNELQITKIQHLAYIGILNHQHDLGVVATVSARRSDACYVLMCLDQALMENADLQKTIFLIPMLIIYNGLHRCRSFEFRHSEHWIG